MNVKEFYNEKVVPKMKETAEKVKETANKAKAAGKIVVDTFKENPTLAVMAIASVKDIISIVVATTERSREENQARLQTHDAYSDCDLTTKHELTNAEILEMTERMKTGQTKAEALNDMGLLKKERRR